MTLRTDSCWRSASQLEFNFTEPWFLGPDRDRVFWVPSRIISLQNLGERQCVHLPRRNTFNVGPPYWFSRTELQEDSMSDGYEVRYVGSSSVFLFNSVCRPLKLHVPVVWLRMRSACDGQATSSVQTGQSGHLGRAVAL